jgi:hypothetical protein
MTERDEDEHPIYRLIDTFDDPGKDALLKIVDGIMQGTIVFAMSKGATPRRRKVRT